MVGEFFDGGGELGVVASELADRLDQALDGVVFCRGRHSQGVKGLYKFFRYLFANLLLRVLVGDDGVGCEAGFAGGELVQLLDVDDCRVELFLRWRPLAFNRGLFLPCEVLGVYEARGSEVCLHLYDHLGLADGYFAIRR